MTRHSVSSSNIASIGHDPDTKTLEVEFTGNGHVYRYAGVTPDEHRELMNAGSIGSHFHRNIRSNYTGSKV